MYIVKYAHTHPELWFHKWYASGDACAATSETFARRFTTEQEAFDTVRNLSLRGIKAHAVQIDNIYSERDLLEDIISVWGERGGQADLFRSIIAERERLRAAAKAGV